MTTTPDEPQTDPTVVPSGDPNPDSIPAQPGEDPGSVPQEEPLDADEGDPALDSFPAGGSAPEQ